MTPLRLFQAFIRPSSTSSSVVRQVTAQPERKDWLSRSLAYIDERFGSLISVKGAGPPTSVTVQHKPSAAGALPAVQAHKDMLRNKTSSVLLFFLHVCTQSTELYLGLDMLVNQSG